MYKILFLIHDLGAGGAEKVLVNLVNNMNRSKFHITVMSLFGGGVNEQFLKPDVRYITIFDRMFHGNSKLMKLLSPKQLHRLFIREKYDIEISYLEGPSARIISGCDSPETKLVSWIHVEQKNMKNLAKAFRSEKEAVSCYNRFDQINCVSEFVKKDFCDVLKYQKDCKVIYNTVESNVIKCGADEETDKLATDDIFRLIAVGTLKDSKGYDRLLRCIKRLVDDGEHVHLYVLGVGPSQEKLEAYVSENALEHNVTFLGYDTNPYKYVSKCDLFVCASYAEGFSTAATEALIVGTPVCTVDVSGMKEMLGYNNEYGIVTENNEVALYDAIKTLVQSPDTLLFYKTKTLARGEMFSTHRTVMAVEKMLFDLIGDKNE